MTAEPLSPPPALHLVCATTDKSVLHAHLLGSAGISAGGGRWPGLRSVTLVHRPRSAAAAFNAAGRRVLRRLGAAPGRHWLLWVHQDVRLPDGWWAQFSQALQQASARWSDLAVVGVYGLSGWGESAVRAGEVCDRGQWLREPNPLPCLASSLDELLVAVDLAAGLWMDESLGFDFYATDLCLQARAGGHVAAVLRAPCFHESATPAQGSMPQTTLARIAESGEAFERKWERQLPVLTPCFEIRKPGDVRSFIERHFTAQPDD